MLLAALLAAAGLAAQEPPSNRLAYDPAFFAGSRPANAYDMVRRLPGFTLVERDEEVRGFAGASGNVLIDGRLPANKQESLEELLGRIPAGAVERIELIRGGAPGIDMAGFDVVANVVRRRAQSRQAAAEAGLSIGLDGRPRPSGRIEASREGDGRRLEAALAYVSQLDEDSGRGAIEEYSVASGQTDRETRRETEVESRLAGSGGYERPIAGGRGSVTASLERERSGERVLSRFADGAEEAALEQETIWSGEGTARYRRDQADRGSVEALLLQRLGRIRVEEQEEDELFLESTRTRETIVRLDYRREQGNASLHAAIEGALNGLVGRARLIEGDTEIPLPGSDASVREARAESTLAVTWRARPDIVVEAALQAEASALRSEAQRLSFLFWKPRATLTAPAGPGQLRLSLAREVGQLDFRDFVASASIDRGDVSAGAVSLRPPQVWAATAAWELRFWDEGAISLSWRREWIDDVVDRVAVIAGGEVFDAAGNIGSGRRDVVDAEFAFPLARFGLEGVQVRGRVTWRRSRVTDPTTGGRRPISEDVPLEGEIRLLHDLPGGRWSWGLDLALAERERGYRFDEVRVEREGASLSFHAEYRPSPAWRVRLEALNLTGRTVSEVREEYDGFRGLVPLAGFERRRIETSRLFLLTVRHSFGPGRPEEP